MDPFRKYIEKLTTPGRDKAIDYMCDRFNGYYFIKRTHAKYHH